jgi:hypothetical protein
VTCNFSLRNAMSNPSADEEQPLSPAAARVVAQVRWLMVIAGATTLIAIAAVIGVIGYRLLRAEKSAPAGLAEATAVLPKGARILGAAANEDRIIVTLDIGGATEIRIFDARTLRPAGRLRFATEP